MRLPILQETSRKIKRDTITFAGLNRNALIADNELSASKNISLSRYAPLISCRAPREVLSTLVSPQALSSVETNIATVDGTSFKYNGVTKGTVTAGEKSMADLNGKIIILPDKKYYDYGSGTFGDMTDTGDLATVPDMDYVCIHANRAFGVKGCNIYCCKQGDITNWTTYDTVATTAWYAEVETEGGNFTGIVSYQNHVVIFKKGFMYELYNNKPPYSVLRVNKVGCISNKAIAEVDSVLYFVGEKGVYAYAGGIPKLVSDNLNETYSDARLGTDGRLLYASLYNGTEWNLYVYDTKEGNWIREDNLQVVQFTRIGEHCYALAFDGKLYKFNSGVENNIECELETKEFTEETFFRKHTGAIHIRADLSLNTIFNLYISVDGGAYSLVKTVTATAEGINKFYKELKPKRCDRFKVKITTIGDFKLYAFGRDVHIEEGY